METLTGKTAIITGGSRGIGFGIAKQFVKEGIDVMICARGEDRLNRARQELEEHPGTASSVPADITNPQDCEHLVEETVEEFGGLDILVNNAGVGEFETVEEMTDEQWKRVIDTNLTGTFYVTRSALPELKKGEEPAFVQFLSSLAGKNAFEKGSAYCASKFGLNGFAKSLMLEVRHDDVKVASIAPGSVHTGFSHEDKSDWALEPGDIAETAVHLLKHRTDSLPSYVEMRPFQPPK